MHGETSNYTVRVSFGKFLMYMHNEVLKHEERLSLPVVNRALVSAFNSDDVLVRCSCPDFLYRINYHLSMAGGVAGEMETRPSDITNPGDTKGRGCKHIEAALTNNSWLSRVARVIFNYINYMSLHYLLTYAEIIYPAIFEKDYDDVYLLDLDILNKNDLDTNDKGDSDILDTSSKWAKEKDKFKPGNLSGWLFAKNSDSDDLLSLDLDNSKEEKLFDVNSEL